VSTTYRIHLCQIKSSDIGTIQKQENSDNPPRTINTCYGDAKAASAARRKGVSAKQTEALEAPAEGRKSP